MVFTGNTASGSGGAIFNDGFGGGMSSPQITNATFTGNAAFRGGAINNFGSDGGTSSPLVTNATFTGNAADGGGAISNVGNNGMSRPLVTNVILWGNEATGGSGDEIFNADADATPTLRHTLIQGGLDGISENTARPQPTAATTSASPRASPMPLIRTVPTASSVRPTTGCACAGKSRY